MLSSDSVLGRVYSTENVVFPKKFRTNFKKSYQDEAFNYRTLEHHESVWQRVQRRLVKLLQSIFGKVDPLKTGKFIIFILRLLAILVVGCVVYLVVKYLLAKNGALFFSRKNKSLKIPEGDIHEDIHQINFSEAILKYESEGDYRSAVRYRFLQTLKKLSDQKLIDWNMEKTNRDYLAELKIANQKAVFRELTYIFDYVWYGEFKISDQDYLNFKIKFEQSNL